MLIKVNQVNQARKAILSHALSHLANTKRESWSMAAHRLGGQSRINPYSTSSPYLAGSDKEEPVLGKTRADAISLDRKVAMYRMRNSVSEKSLGLKSGTNRNNLVSEFYDLSKSVIDDRISVDEFIASKTFNQLHEQIEFHIDVMSNAQVVSILASLIKMKVNPSTNLMKLLEHEVKFRINSLSSTQVIKLIKFYNTIETSYEQKQLTDVLNNQVRISLQNSKSSIKEMIEVFRYYASQQPKSMLLGLVEEKLLNILTERTAEEDDIVSRFLPKTEPPDYETLCELFIELAANRRRPTPLLRAASLLLCKKQCPKEQESKPTVLLLISTLNALIQLSYPNRTLVSKLISDLSETIKLEELDITTQCNLLRSMGKLRWRSDNLLKIFYDYVESNYQDPKLVDHNLTTTLLHITAQLNYKPEKDIKEFYNLCVKASQKEDMFDKLSRKWLNHVWSLVALNIADKEHIKSVLNVDFIQKIENSSDGGSVVHADIMKLLNLRALAKLEFKMNDLITDHLDELTNHKIQRGADLQKFSLKIREALNGIAKSSMLRHEIPTPFGFIVDCELLLNDNLDPISLDDAKSLEETIQLAETNQTIPHYSQAKKCALIYALFDETIANKQTEVVGHKSIIGRILKSIGYETVFLTENSLSREKTSADLSNKVRSIIQASAGKREKLDGLQPSQ